VNDYPVYMGCLVTPAGAAFEVWASDVSRVDIPAFVRAVEDYVAGKPDSPRALFFNGNYSLKPVGADSSAIARCVHVEEWNGAAMRYEACSPEELTATIEAVKRGHIAAKAVADAPHVVGGKQ
jgi:hypothetical protein